MGVGELPDADKYGDRGSDTVGSIARRVGLRIPTLRALGLTRAARLAETGPADAAPVAAFGRMAEASPGKDSVTGHWELMGLVLQRPFPVFPEGFPGELIEEFERRIGRKTIGNTVASGTVIIDELGPEHMRTGRPIVYTSADSVFQIAAHEEVIPVPELYRICEIGFDLVAKGHGVGRVIARPFVGVPGSFSRTANRRDFALTPFEPTLLDRLKDAGHAVMAIGKIEDLFAGRGMTSAVHTKSDDHGMDEVESAMSSIPDGLIFANLVDFDTRVRTPERSRGIRRESRAVRRAARRAAAALRGRRPAGDHGRSRQRSVHAEYGSFPRVRARAPVRAPVCAPAPTSACGRRSRISGRPSRRTLASGLCRTGRVSWIKS